MDRTFPLGGSQKQLRRGEGTDQEVLHPFRQQVPGNLKVSLIYQGKNRSTAMVLLGFLRLIQPKKGKECLEPRDEGRDPEWRLQPVGSAPPLHETQTSRCLRAPSGGSLRFGAPLRTAARTITSELDMVVTNLEAGLVSDFSPLAP